jgi:hypothetical protein
MGYAINNDETKAIKKIIKKFSGNKIDPTNQKLRGSFKITNFRKYPNVVYDEIDIEFKGEIFAKTSLFGGQEWLSSEIYSQKGVSKIKINKLIKRHILSEIKAHAVYFGINIKFTQNLKKITWV